MFRHLELGVAIELFMSETALECDIVLPETSFYEQAEIRQGMWLGPEAVLCQPAVPPVGEAKPLYEIVKGIASRMGWGQYFAWDKWEDWGARVIRGTDSSANPITPRRERRSIPSASVSSACRRLGRLTGSSSSARARLSRPSRREEATGRFFPRQGATSSGDPEALRVAIAPPQHERR